MAVCLNHTDVEAVTRCAACGKPLCAACVAVRDGGDYCSDQCHARGKEAAAQSDAVIGAKAATAKSRKIRLLIVLFIIIAVAAAAAMYYKQNKNDSRADAAVRQVKATAAKTEKAVSKEAGAAKQTLNTKSKYKREREALVK